MSWRCSLVQAEDAPKSQIVILSHALGLDANLWGLWEPYLAARGPSLRVRPPA